MDKIYARVVDGVVFELIQALQDEKGNEIPLHKVFTEDFVKQCVEVPRGELPKQGWEFKNAIFSEPLKENKPNHQEDYTTLRLIAYADPVNGSDRYFAEALALQADGYTASSVEVKELKQKGLARKEEIKLAYPKS